MKPPSRPPSPLPLPSSSTILSPPLHTSWGILLMPLQPLSSESNDSPSRKNGKKAANFKITILASPSIETSAYPSPVARSLFSVPRFPFPVPRSLYFTPCSSFPIPISCSLFLVLGFLSSISRYPLFAPHSYFFRSLFLVVVTSAGKPS